jgi:hypothetical protein
MLRVALALALVVSVASASAAVAGGDRLLVTDRSQAKGTSRLRFELPGPVSDLPLGGGRSAIAASVIVRVDSTSAEYAVPAGAFQGSAGWRRNRPKRALFLNRKAPAGPTVVKKIVVDAGDGLLLLAKGLGDTPITVPVTGAPSEAVDVQYAVTSGDVTGRRCLHFDAADCGYEALDEGAGGELDCREGDLDPGCTAFGGPSFTCTELMGFSQTLQFYQTAEFQQQVDDARWQMLFRAGGDVDVWADPTSEVWTAPVAEACSGSPILCSPCSEGSDAPDRVLFTITLQDHESSVPTWVEKIRAAIVTIRTKRPAVREIVLQPVIGGPGHAICPADNPNGVRASYNHPYIDQAIAEVVQDAPDLVAGMSPEVASCSDYEDEVGHLTEEARPGLGLAIGQYYGSQE